MIEALIPVREQREYREGMKSVLASLERSIRSAVENNIIVK